MSFWKKLFLNCSCFLVMMLSICLATAYLHSLLSEAINTVCEQYAKIFNVKASGTLHLHFKGQMESKNLCVHSLINEIL